MIHTLLRGFTLIAALLFAFSTTLTANSSYSYLPKHIYPNQLFAVTVMVKDVLEQEFLQLHCDETSPVHPLFEKPLIIEHG
ncbi:MAG TPA: hypothetical protein ENK71_01350, partial [Epsilonproteobacteria bacterium]|nr:hypothetical protein [Campylobacterota bacterium]